MNGNDSKKQEGSGLTTIKDVAEQAGVGIATVSRMINHTGYVSEEARERIEAAIRELDFIPNERARNLSRKRSGIIGVIIPDFQTPFYASFIRQVEIELYKYGYKTMVCNTVKTSDREKEYVDMLKRNIVDGIITGALSVEDTVYKEIDKPIVSMDHDLGPRIPLIHSDHKKGGQMVAEYLASRGCRRVIQIGGCFQVNTPSNDRYIEFEKVMNAYHISVRTLEMEWNRTSYSYYMDLMQKYVDELKEADGIFASDMGAIALYHFASDMGIKVPQQLKIVGYDGTDMTRMVTPVVTAVCQDIPLLAKKCVDTVMKLVQGEGDIDYHQVTDVYFQKGGTA